MKTAKNPRGQIIPVYTRTDLERMNMMRKDATIHQIWPTTGKPADDIFYFDPGNGDLRPSVLVKRAV